jgi:hypothetical protein
VYPGGQARSFAPTIRGLLSPLGDGPGRWRLRPSSPATAEATVAEKRTALASYERVRSALARDAVGAIAANAEALERDARAVATADRARSAVWTSLADAAKALHGMPKQDADAVRRSFGDVSKHLLSALAEDEEAARGLHVFECTMAQAYDKWVQPAERISNPYMGTRMPECGSRSSL